MNIALANEILIFYPPEYVDTGFYMGICEHLHICNILMSSYLLCFIDSDDKYYWGNKKMLSIKDYIKKEFYYAIPIFCGFFDKDRASLRRVEASSEVKAYIFDGWIFDYI